MTDADMTEFNVSSLFSLCSYFCRNVRYAGLIATEEISKFPPIQRACQHRFVLSAVCGLSIRLVNDASLCLT